MGRHFVQIRGSIQQLLEQCVSVLALDIDDSSDLQISYAVQASALAIILAGSVGSIPWIFVGIAVTKEIVVAGLFIVLGWLVFTYIFITDEQRNTLVPLHLHLASFWILVTAIFIAFAWYFFSSLPRITERILLTWALLIISVPVHILRRKIGGVRKLIYIPSLLLSNGTLAAVASSP